MNRSETLTQQPNSPQQTMSAEALAAHLIDQCNGDTEMALVRLSWAFIAVENKAFLRNRDLT